MNELSLFTGAGGGILGTHLLGWRPVGYVEFNDYCQRVLAARIRDGYIPNAPIFGDIRAFLDEGWAAVYQGMVDVVTAGFPCQPFSVAGKRRGEDDPRNMWPATAEVIHLVEPRWCLLENVPGLLAGSHGYFGQVLRDMASMGYDARWGVLGARHVGAPHRRDRLWIVAAHPQRAELREQPGRCSGTDGEGATELGYNGAQGDVADATRVQLRQKPHPGAYAAGHQSKGALPGQQAILADSIDPGQQDPQGGAERGGEPGRGAAASGGWWDPEPDVGRVAHGVASRVDRLRALGNGQVPAVVRLAWETLSR